MRFNERLGQVIKDPQKKDVKPQIVVQTANVLVSMGLCALLRANAFQASVGEGDPLLCSADAIVVDTVSLVRRIRKGFSQNDQRTRVILIDTGVASDKVSAVMAVFNVHAFILPNEGLEKLISAVEVAAGGQVASRIGPRGDLVPVSATDGTKAITNREKEVVELVLQGFNNRQVGAHLFISPYTVKTHLYSIYRKLGLNSRFDLIRLAHPASSNRR